MSALSTYARDYFSRVRTHGQSVADGVDVPSDGPSATSADEARAPGAAAPPAAAPDVRPPVPAADWISVCVKCERIFPGAGSQCPDCGGEW